MLHDKVQKFGVSKTMPVLWVVANDRTVARRKSVQENYLVRERHLSGRPASYRRDKGARYLGVEYTCAIMTTRTRKPKAKAVRQKKRSYEGTISWTIEEYMRQQRIKRLKKINAAKTDIESALLTIRQDFKITWTNGCFENLYYLVRLARKAP